VRRIIVVCLRCGEFKDGLAPPCPKCGYDPGDVRDKARQMLASDRYHSREEMEGIAVRIKAGERVEFDREAVHAGFMREEVKRLVAAHGTVPPPWVVFEEHPYSICWRMGGGETHLRLWWEWWGQQGLPEEERVAYFRRWPPPHCWFPYLIEAIWGVDRSDGDERLRPYFERTAALGFGSWQEYEQDLDDPKWLPSHRDHNKQGS
jgi:hypothetical protein